MITLPYLVRTLGPSEYGAIALSQSSIIFFNILTDYGFNLSATKQISIEQESVERVSKVFSSVLYIKILLVLISFLILIALIAFVPQFHDHKYIFLVSYGVIIGNAIFPMWLFQGLEKVKYVTILNIVFKSLSTALIFIFVKGPSDSIFIPTINSLSMISISLISILLITIQLKIKFVRVPFASFTFQLKEGWHTFLSTIAMNLYTSSNVLILGFATNTSSVAYYDGAQKIVTAASGIVSPFSQAIYPYVSRLLIDSKEDGMRVLRRTLKIVAVCTFITSLVIYSLADKIVYSFLGKGFSETIPVLKVLAFVPFLIGLSNVFGILTMLPLGYKKLFSRIIVSASLTHLLLSVVLAGLFKELGTAISVVTIECLITLVMYLSLKKRNVVYLKLKEAEPRR